MLLVVLLGLQSTLESCLHACKVDKIFILCCDNNLPSAAS